MKLIIRLLIISLAVIGVLNLNLKAANEVHSKAKEDYTTQWMSMFTTLVRAPSICTPPDRLRNKDQSKTTENETGVEVMTPSPKANRYAKEQGFGPSAYLFDHWEEIFKDDVVNYFTKMFNAAKAITPPAPSVYEEPYSLDKMLYYYTQGVKGSLSGIAGNPADVVQEIAKYNLNFKPAVWQNSISAAQVFQIIQDWGWKTKFANNPPKKLVDKFDFDGDGRLNPSEFILFAIWNNRKIFRLPECKQYCFEEIFKAKIDPLFAFLDCDQDGYISSENMWNTLSLLKRKDPTKYSMYNCVMPSVLNKGYRTISCNDFILKNYNKADGYLDINEFRAGILLGYWDRNTDFLSIFNDDQKNLKSSRWSPDGSRDLVCDSIMSLLPGGVPIIPPPPMSKESFILHQDGAPTMSSSTKTTTTTTTTGPAGGNTAPAQAPVTPAQAPVAPAQAPVAPAQAPVAPVQAPVAPVAPKTAFFRRK